MPLSSTHQPLRFLVVESETDEEREARRESAGKSAGETFAATLGQMEPGCETGIVAPSRDADDILSADALYAWDAVFLSGSPLHVYEDSVETRRQIAFMHNVFCSGTPSFGACAGLQIAAAAAGGSVRAMVDRKEAGVARRIVATEEGREHPLLRGRPATWDALAVHNDEVETLPDGALLLATSETTRVQAVEIRQGYGVFWGVQYHPELAPGEIAAALRRQTDDLINKGLARDDTAVERQAELFDALHDAPDARWVRWQLGVDGEVACEPRRRVELRNFIDQLVHPTRDRRRQ